ncbi:unnamed protein product, partial [Rotaria sp. Silwood2]
IADGLCLVAAVGGTFIPTGEKLSNTAATLAGYWLKRHEYKRYQKRMSLITNAGTIVELTDIARQVAYKLAIRYKDQLEKLQRPEKGSEIVHARKIRELELYNNRSLVQKLIEDYSKDSVSEVQLTRLYELEQGLRHLDLEHNKLFRRVKRNECYCNKNKIKHNNQIIQIEENFEDYQREIKEYHETLNKSMADHREHLQVLNTKQELILRQQEKHEISINNLSLQRHNLEQLLRYIKQTIN